MDASNQQPLNKVMLNTNGLKQVCSSCSLRELCLPIGLEAPDMDRLDRLVTRRKHIQRGEHVFRVGAPFQFLFAIRTGFF